MTEDKIRAAFEKAFADQLCFDWHDVPDGASFYECCDTGMVFSGFQAGYQARSDEMVEVVAANCRGMIGHIVDYSRSQTPSPYTANDVAKEALAAAYPLIRAQVLEEAAGVCDKRAEEFNRIGNLGDAAVTLLCSTAIRDMKGDV